MHLGADDIRRIHEVFGGPAELIAQRRAVYAVAVELFAAGEVPEPCEDVLDNPLVRAHLGELLGGAAGTSAESLQPLSELVATGYSTLVGDHAVRLASSRNAGAAMKAPLMRVADELGRHGEESWVSDIVVEDDDRVIDVWTTLIEGVQLALRLAPELTDDLLPHISVFAVVRSADSDRLGSASAREYPGLIVVPEPTSALEVAEAVIHEGAHQKFFDIDLSKGVLPPPSSTAPRYLPSWAAPGGPSWPLEQTFAAFHAYVCLGVLARAARAAFGLTSEMPPHSLLPFAPRRAAEIGEWLLGQDEILGHAGRQLLRLLLGRRPLPASRTTARPARGELRPASEDVFRRCGSQTLIARRGEAVELYWLDDAP